MTRRLRALSISRARRRLGGALVGAIALCAVMAPAPAYAWWGWLEKMSGPAGLNGPQFEFRVACFGDPPREAATATGADQLTTEALAASRVAARSAGVDSVEWQAAESKWKDAARAWATVLDVPAPVQSQRLGSWRVRAEDWRSQAFRFENSWRAGLMATSSAGVAWSFCKPDKERRLALDILYGLFKNDGSPEFAGGEPISLTTLMPAISWRVFGDKSVDFIEVSAGGGVYWFSSPGFPSKQGVVLQPGRITFRAPSSWSGALTKDQKPDFLKRLAAIPVYGVGFTVFPGGFEATDFAGSGDRAVRIPRELLTTQYFFVNVEPLIRLVR